MAMFGKSEGIPNPEPLIWYLVFGMTFSSHDVECMAKSIQRDIVSFILAAFSKNDKVRKSISLRQLSGSKVVDFEKDFFKQSFGGFPVDSVNFKSEIHFEKFISNYCC
jgi:hypothetical protein